MQRYLAARVVTPAQAALVGYPKLDALVAGGFDVPRVRAGMRLGPGPLALYAPTYSEASSLHLAGEAIVRALVSAGLNVAVKLHDRSLDPDPRYNGGIDWRARFAALAAGLPPGTTVFVETADASPLLAAADLLVTDHSSIGFEYLVRDRPLLVYDAPGLAAAARINPEKIAQLREAAVVVRTPQELRPRPPAKRCAIRAISSSVRRRIGGPDVLRRRPRHRAGGRPRWPREALRLEPAGGVLA